MSALLPSGLLVSVLLRRVNDAGGIAAVRARGDAERGGILLILSEKGEVSGVVERALDLNGQASLRPAGPGAAVTLMAIETYWRARRARDPDLWVVELDIASAERFAAETILQG